MTVTIKLPPIPQAIEDRLSDFAVACAFMNHEARASSANRLREAITEHARESVRLNMAPLSDELLETIDEVPDDTTSDDEDDEL